MQPHQLAKQLGYVIQKDDGIAMPHWPKGEIIKQPFCDNVAYSLSYANKSFVYIKGVWIHGHFVWGFNGSQNYKRVFKFHVPSKKMKVQCLNFTLSKL
jgi:hypothetical protein